MSFDLAVWAWKGPLSTREAGGLYLRLCEGRGPARPRSPAVGRFFQEVTARHPQLDDCADSELERCPWSSRIGFPGWYSTLCISWSRAQEVGDFIRRLARQHRLFCYDPQASRLEPPPGVPFLKTDDGAVFARPGEETIRRCLRSLRSGKSKFALFELDEKRYAQWKPAAGGAFAVEVRDGGPDHHFATTGVSGEGVIRICRALGSKRNAWESTHRWQQLSFAAQTP